MTTARERIAELRAEGMTYTEVARALNAEGVPTPSGRGRWKDSNTANHLNRLEWNAYMNAYKSDRRAGRRRR